MLARITVGLLTADEGRSIRDGGLDSLVECLFTVSAAPSNRVFEKIVDKFRGFG